jgi:hypothetical protein
MARRIVHINRFVPEQRQWWDRSGFKRLGNKYALPEDGYLNHFVKARQDNRIQVIRHDERIESFQQMRID